ncbi:MAG TPA: hypothetical protein VGC13_16230 [Longimicrobium sp.]|jgi:hypothetical protein|uniref:hypothetical protein n=1 Tax=Longimicrobium sp. TaxID=2029185 RepID=UPI002ED8051F
MAMKLNMENITVESFAVSESIDDQVMNHTWEDPCFSVGEPRCTLPCVMPSDATNYAYCCG